MSRRAVCREESPKDPVKKENDMKELDNKELSVICAGFGGQGIMVLGKVLANCGLEEGKNVTWLPSYGAEVRGGTAHSQVKISGPSIASPLVGMADVIIIMNQPSLKKFLPRLKKKGLLIINSSMVKNENSDAFADKQVVKAPLTEEAIRIGNVRVANMIAAGILIGRTGAVRAKTLEKVIRLMAENREELIPPNLKAIRLGIEIADKEDNER